MQSTSNLPIGRNEAQCALVPLRRRPAAARRRRRVWRTSAALARAGGRHGAVPGGKADPARLPGKQATGPTARGARRDDMASPRRASREAQGCPRALQRCPWGAASADRSVTNEVLDAVALRVDAGYATGTAPVQRAASVPHDPLNAAKAPRRRAPRPQQRRQRLSHTQLATRPGARVTSTTTTIVHGEPHIVSTAMIEIPQGTRGCAQRRSRCRSTRRLDSRPGRQEWSS
jgi:hypothetical protein